MKTNTLQFYFTIVCTLFFYLSGNSQCAPEISGYTNLGLYNDHSYYISTSNVRPTDAQAAAEALGGYLAVINDADENEFIENYVEELTYIGFNDATTEGTIETVNGEPVTYTNIDPCSFCQVNDANNDFVVMEPWGNGGEWSFSNFFNQRKYIVEIPCGTSNNSSECSFVKELVAQNFPTSSASSRTRVLENPNDYEVRFESVLFGPERRLVKWNFDQLGNEISLTDISGPYPTGMDFGRISDLGDYFFMHDIIGLNPQLNKYDFSGNTVFSKTYTVNTTISNISYTASRDAWEDEDGILVTGHSGDGPDGLRQPFLIKTDLDGNEQWQVLLPTENKFVSLNVQGRSSDGGYYLILGTGSNQPAKVIKIDATGNILWTHETPLNSIIVDRNHLGESPDGSSYYYVQNDPGSSSSLGYWGFRLDASTGAVIWEKEIGEVFSISPSIHDFGGNGAAISSDGGLFVDFSYFLGNTYIGDKYGKLNSNGDLVWGYDKPKHFRRMTARLGTSDGGLLLFGGLGNDFSKRFFMKITDDGFYAPICEGGNNSATLETNCDFGFTGPFPDNPLVYIDPAQNPNGEVITWDAPTGTTTCPGGAVTVELVNGFPSGSTFTVGNFDVLYKISDACGNEKFCGLELRVRGPLPMINCTADITINATSSAGAVVNYAIPTVTTPAGGTCSYGPFDLTSGANTASGSQFSIGTTEVEYISWRTGSPSLCEHLPDISICTFNVTVVDNGTGGGCPQDITGFTTLGEFGDSKYYISNSNSRPVDAQAVAESFGGYLVSVNSQAENDFIQQYADGLTYIGLTDENVEGSLEWFNGDPVTYNNVDPCGFCNENSPSQDYGVIQPWDGGWSFSNFWNSRKYIMEIPCNGGGGNDECSFNNLFSVENTLNPLTVSYIREANNQYEIVSKELISSLNREIYIYNRSQEDGSGNSFNQLQMEFQPFNSNAAQYWDKENGFRLYTANIVSDQLLSLLKYNATGDVITSFNIDITGFDMYGISSIKKFDNAILIISNSGPTNTLATIKTDLNGNLLWKKHLAVDVDNGTSGNILGESNAGGHYISYINGGPFVVKIDDGGNIDWSANIGTGDPPSIKRKIIGESGDGQRFYFQRNSFNTFQGSVTAFDTNTGQVSWGFSAGQSFAGGSNAFRSSMNRVIPTNDGGAVVFYGYHLGFAPTDFIYLHERYDADGNLVWSRETPEDIRTQLGGTTLAASDGGFIFAGNETNNFWRIIRMTSDGFFEPDCNGPVSLPDLTLENLENLTSNTTVGAIEYFEFDLLNIGNATTNNTYSIVAFISTDTELSPDDYPAGTIQTANTVVGTDPNVPGAITVPDLPDGDYYMLLVVDPFGAIIESNEDNNIISEPITIGSSGGGCPTSLSGFISLGEFNGSAYFLSNDVSRPTDAQNTATSNGGNLAVINSQAENDFIFNQINELVYIGINDATTEGTLEWVDGSGVGFTNFDICSFCTENESTKDYVVMHGWNGGWSWSSVWNQRKYIVEIECLTPLQPPSISNTLIAFPTNEREKLTLDKLMPNPANDYIFASIFSPSENEVEVNIIDARGVLVKSEIVGVHDGSNTIEMNIADLPSGFYMMQIPNAPTNNSMLRFVKQRD